MVNWSQIKDIDTLKQLGSFRKVKENLSKELQMCITARSWEKLFEKLKIFQDVFAKTSSNVTQPSYSEDFDSDLPYFRSETDRAIFILVETDGRCRQRLLNVTPTHYGDPELAKQWMRSLAKLVHPDITNHFKAKEAMSNLDEMYGEMIGK